MISRLSGRGLVLRPVAIVIMLLTGLFGAANAHFSAAAIERFLVVTERDGRLVAFGRVPLPIVMARDVAAGVSPFLAQQGLALVLPPEALSDNPDGFVELITGSHQWLVGGAPYSPTLVRWRLALATDEGQLNFAADPGAVLSRPTYPRAAPLGLTLLDFELDLGPYVRAQVQVRMPHPPLDLAPGFTVTNHLVDDTGFRPFERRVEGQLPDPETIVMPLGSQVRLGGLVGVAHALLGVGLAVVVAAMAAATLGARQFVWVAAGLLSGQQIGIEMPSTALGTGLASELVPLGLAVLAVSLLAAVLALRPTWHLPALVLAGLVGLASGATLWTRLGEEAGRLPVSLAGHVGMLIGTGLLLTVALGARQVLGVHRAATIGVLALALAASGTAESLSVVRQAEGQQAALLRLRPEAALEQGFDLIGAVLVQLHRGVEGDGGLLETLVQGDPQDVFPTDIRSLLADTGLPSMAVHEVSLKTFQLRRRGDALEVSAAWTVLGLRSQGQHTHAEGNRFAADFTLVRNWGRWRIAEFDLKKAP